MQDFEKLGVFYLGKSFDLPARKRTDRLVLYESKDLVTHAVCVGMTGSGKTGLCLSILEEAAIDGIPCIAIDPKGDISNLLLTFPQLRGEDFAPWVNESDAQRAGVSVSDFASQQAEKWKRGLADWGQDGTRIQRLKDAADFAVYTPGSNAGISLSILKSFDAPSETIREDAELFRERIATTATSLLGLLGIEGDPVQSREHILLSAILGAAWKDGKDLDLGAMIQQIQSPPMTRVGVMDIESFFPSKDRFALAMRLNNLLASPGFESWMTGEPLDVASMLYTPAGKPRIAIVSIAHLSDAERMFFVSLLLNEILGWVRAQPGTTSLRALLYMDEIFGYFPPVANPPSKQPLLTLLKQARAFGFGVMLATQNPVDLDYKGLANAGTWFIGRLQTERDKARLIDGLEGASSGAGKLFDRQQFDRMLSSLQQRVFLMNNVHDDEPEIFESRWALSYLRGPLTKQQIKTLMEPRKNASSAVSSQAGAKMEANTSAKSGARPVLPPQIRESFLPLRSTQPDGAALVYRPALLGCGKVYFRDTKTNTDTAQEVCSIAPLVSGPAPVNFEKAESVDLNIDDLETSPAPNASFSELPSAAAQPKNYDAWKKSFADVLFRTQKIELYRSPSLGEVSRAGESERDFRVRLQQRAREERDAFAETLRKKYAPKIAVLEERLRRAKQAAQREQEQASQSTWQAAMTVGASILGAFMGRKTVSAANIGRAATAARGMGRTWKERSDVARAEETIGAVESQIAELDAQFKAETDALAMRIDPATETFEKTIIRPKKTDITVNMLTLAWAPYWESDSGAEAAWQ